MPSPEAMAGQLTARWPGRSGAEVVAREVESLNIEILRTVALPDDLLGILDRHGERTSIVVNANRAADYPMTLAKGLYYYMRGAPCPVLIYPYRGERR
jgi:hypothetical protein